MTVLVLAVIYVLAVQNKNMRYLEQWFVIFLKSRSSFDHRVNTRSTKRVWYTLSGPYDMLELTLYFGFKNFAEQWQQGRGASIQKQ